MSIPATSGSNISTPQVPAHAEIARFWWRILALLIDMALLGFVGIIIGFLAFRTLVAIGQAGRLIGAVIALLYYGGLNSRLGGGATVGKRALGIKVVDREGKEISLPRSLLRTAIFWTPYYLNGVIFPGIRVPVVPASLMYALGFLDALIVFGGLGLIIYFYVFNTRTRQSFHDLIVGTFVTKKETVELPVQCYFWRGHIVIAGICGVLVLASGAVVLKYVYSSPTGALLSRTTELANVVDARPGVAFAQVQISTFWSSSSGTHKVLTINARLNEIPVSMDTKLNDIAETVLRASPALFGEEALGVNAAYGCDIGIFQWTVTSRYVATKEEWVQRLNASGMRPPI